MHEIRDIGVAILGAEADRSIAENLLLPALNTVGKSSERLHGDFEYDRDGDAGNAPIVPVGAAVVIV